jgi:hypothetical protein
LIAGGIGRARAGDQFNTFQHFPTLFKSTAVIWAN